MNISFLGGAKEIGASCMLLEVDGKKILLDCGIRQGGTKDVLPDFRTIQDLGGIDAIIISHAHTDHTGALPIISKEYPDARIYMNNMTKDLIKVLLYDSLKIMNSREAEIPLYAEKDVEEMLNRVFTINYQREFEIIEGIKIAFYPVGHIAGASGVYLLSKEGSLFYSGDFSIFPQRSIDGAKIPKLRPDIAIFESTYGDKLHSNRDIEEDKLIDLVREGIEAKGKILIPAFALGRSQEVILILKSAMNRGKLPKVKVYVDGMIKNVNRVYKNNPLYLKSSLGKKILKGVEPFYDDYITAVATKEERENILQSKESVVIVSSSGMMTGGPSQFYGEAIASMENGYIIITGYQDEESPGRKLLNLLEFPKEERIFEISGKSFPVKCKIERVGLSAHGDKSEIKALIDLLAPKNIFLVHGEEGIIESLAGEISSDVRARIYAPKSGERVEVKIGVPRKQIKKELPFVLNSNKELNKDNVEKLWEFIRYNYGERLFTLEELLTVWKGVENYIDSELEELKGIIIATPYFENDLRRFFMFRANTKEVVEEELRPKELKPNEIDGIVREYFKAFNFKKISIRMQEKKVILIFDFPKAVNKDIYNKMKEFEAKVSWKIELNTQTNINAAESLIRSCLPEINIKKISFLLNEDKVVVTCDELKGDFLKVKEKLKEDTGLELIFKGQEEDNSINETETITVGDITPIEQNQAMFYIDECFKEEKFKPYKKSIKSLGNIELAFITPVIGKMHIEKLKEIAKDIGWSISISKAVNQNEVLGLATRLCLREGINLKKNPSFNPSSLTVTLKAENLNGEGLNRVKEEFEENTGCHIQWG